MSFATLHHAHHYYDSPLEFILATGKPHHKPFVKLLGHGGAIVADTDRYQ